MSEDLERVWLVMEAIALSHPQMNMKDGVLLAQKVYGEVTWLRNQGISTPPVAPVYGTTEDLAEWLGQHSPRVCYEIQERKLIQAIKEARAVTRVGLKDAKDACEVLRDNPHMMKHSLPPF